MFPNSKVSEVAKGIYSYPRLGHIKGKKRILKAKGRAERATFYNDGEIALRRRDFINRTMRHLAIKRKPLITNEMHVFRANFIIK